MRKPSRGDAFVVHERFNDETPDEWRLDGHVVPVGTLLVYVDKNGGRDVFLTNYGRRVELDASYRIDRTFAHPLGETHASR